MPPEKKLPLQSSTNANVAAAPVKKTIEQMYQKKTQLEHILLRPDTYIGSIEQHKQSLWVWEDDTMVHKEISYVPGLYKIFDEILVNAADNKQRDPTMDSVKVRIDPDQNLISVYNNGNGIPVEIHQEEGVYVPEMIFGHLLTSSNYDDDEKKTTGGRNGYGAKLTNIFSTEFVIETADGKRQKKYKQVFSCNMGKKSEPIITKCKEGENWTKVSFTPDLAKFNMIKLEDDVVALMKKRVIDIAGCLGKSVKVELNGQRIPVKSFHDYVKLYIQSASKSKPDSSAPEFKYQKVNDRWEVCVTVSEGQFQQVSFVNGIATIKGGTHVDYVTNQISLFIMNAVNKKRKNANLKQHFVKNHLWVFVNALIDNPAFDSQTKETLTIRPGSFGSKCELPQEFLKKVEKDCGVVASLLEWADFKEKKDLKKTDGTKKGKVNVPKLMDANEAGGKESHACTLILTEGDSAKTLAVSGMSVVGRDHYGVFPLRGKLLNVREANHKQIMENAEIQNIKLILGLQHGKDYTTANVKSLRYGHLMIMTDQDHDGSHIKGLLINFIHTFWPSLLKVPSFLIEFITPIVKATNKNKKTEVISFYSMPEYESWKEGLGFGARSWSIKYYKGLGTSRPEEAVEYFDKLDQHRKDFFWGDEHDGEAIELAFSKKKIEARKNWLRHFESGTHLDQNEKLIKYSDFINKELIQFSMADLQRSIPSMVDGLKPGQRKILFCSFKRNLINQIKVTQFSGYVSEHSAYHHGEQSLNSTIVGMAQNFVGSNNVHLFLPEGQFGSRLQGGKDQSSPRYIFTCLSQVTRCLFHKDDDVLLDYLNEDGQRIEPVWYMPIIPTVLVNGSEGIGTGWSTYVPNYNPRDIVTNLRHLLCREPIEPMDPWYKGFKGTIVKTATKDTGVSYTISGLIDEFEDGTLRITELPIRKWTSDYKEFLDEKVKDGFIEDYRDHGDDKKVQFDVYLSPDILCVAKQEGLLKKFKLSTTISTSNMHLFDAKGIIKKYDSPEQILEEFFHLRLEFYEKRKKVKTENLDRELLILENRVRFILAVVEGKIIVSNRKKADLYHELKDKGFDPFPKKSKVEVDIAGATEYTEESGENSEQVNNEETDTADDYGYLLSMAIGTLTIEKVRELCAKRDRIRKEVDDLRMTTPESLWEKDLDLLLIALDAQEKREAEAEEERARKKNGTKRESKPKVSKQSRKPRKNNNSRETEQPMDTSGSSAMETGNVAVLEEPKGKAGGKKAPIKKGNHSSSLREEASDDEVLKLTDRFADHTLNSSQDHSEVMETDLPKKQAKKKEPSRRATVKKQPLPDVGDPALSLRDEEDDADDEVPELKDRLAAYNINLSADHLEDMGTDLPKKEAKKKEPTRRLASKKQPLSDVTEISDDEDFDAEVAKHPEGKKGARKVEQNSKAAKPPSAAARKRGPVGQKLITEVLKPAVISPEKKVRKMRASPFNKKSGSVLARMGDDEEESEDEMGSSPVAPTARPQRANRGKATYIVSSSESDEPDMDDSEFELDED